MWTCVFVLCRCLSVASLSHILNVYLTLQETVRLFSKVAVAFCIPTGKVKYESSARAMSSLLLVIICLVKLQSFQWLCNGSTLWF